MCNGFKIGVDVERMKIGGRFQDKRPAAEKIWATVMQALQEVGALPKGTVAMTRSAIRHRSSG